MEITCRSKALTVSQLAMHFTVSFELNSHARHACNAYVNVYATDITMLFVTKDCLPTCLLQAGVNCLALYIYTT